MSSLFRPRQSLLFVLFLLVGGYFHVFLLSTAVTTTAHDMAMELNLPLGDINVVVLTDVHSWIAGHGRQEPTDDADYGDVLSFYERLVVATSERDLWLVSNGDFVHGTGLGEPGGSPHPNPVKLIPLLEKLPLDALNCGNHELYDDYLIEEMTRHPDGWLDWWGERYLTANVKLVATDSVLGNRFRILKGRNSNLLVFGFLYNMKGSSSLIEIEQVQEVVQSSWFQEACSTSNDNKFDAILVLAHMDLQDPLITVLLDAFRKLVGTEVPIQFLTGHTHYRGIKELDDWSVSVEAGKYLDTIGFVSFPTKATVVAAAEATAIQNNNLTTAAEEAKTTTTTTSLFQSAFIDGSKRSLANALGLNDVSELPTKNGTELSQLIYDTRKEMGLLQEIGCAPQDYLREAPLDAPNSLWGLYRDEVIPKTFFHRRRHHHDQIMLLPSESWRYDLLSHAQTLIVDDIMAVAPFNDTVLHVGSMSGMVIRQLNASLNTKRTTLKEEVPVYVLIGNTWKDGDDDDDDDAIIVTTQILDEKEYHLYTHDFNQDEILSQLVKIIPEKTFITSPTNVTSTMLWLSFVQENWPCDNANHNTTSHDDEIRVMSDVVFPMILIIPYVMTFWFLYYVICHVCCCKFVSVTQREKKVCNKQNSLFQYKNQME